MSPCSLRRRIGVGALVGRRPASEQEELPLPSWAEGETYELDDDAAPCCLETLAACPGTAKMGGVGSRHRSSREWDEVEKCTRCFTGSLGGFWLFGFGPEAINVWYRRAFVPTTVD